MTKIKPQEEMPRLTVYLPTEMERAVYDDFRALAQHAISEATRNVTINTRYLNQKNLCLYLKCGVAQIAEWESHGLRYFMKGKEKMFDLKDVHAFIEEQKI